MTLTADQVHAQVLWEQEGVRRGIQRYREVAAVADPTTLPPGKAMMRAIVGPLVAAIEAAQEEAARDPTVAPGGPGGRPPPDLWVIHLLPPEKAAVITAGCILRAQSSSVPVPTTALATSIARGIRFQVEMDRWERKMLKEREAGVWDALASFRSAYPDAKSRDWRRWRKKIADLEAEEWTHGRAVQVGSRFLNLAVASCPDWLALETTITGGKTKAVLKLAPQAVETLRDLEARAEVARVYRLPMIVPPNPWRYA